MNKTISIVLLVAGILLGLYGYNKYTANTDSGKFLGIELSVQNEEEANTGLIFMGLGALLLIGGIVGVAKK